MSDTWVQVLPNALRMELHITRAGVFAPQRVDPRGTTGPTRGQARGPRWTHVGPHLFRPTGVAETTEQRIVDAVASMPSGTAVTGWAALHWLGARWFDGLAPDGGRLPIPIAGGDRRGLRQRSGIVISEDWLFDDDIVVIDGLPITMPLRSVTYEARVTADAIGALRAIEMAAYDDLVSLAELRTYTAKLVGRPGKVQLEDALAVADENVWSPMETVMRRFWQQQWDRPLLCNQPLFDLGGHHLFTPDVLDLEAGIAGEYDGSVHDRGRARSKDLDRDELTKRLGIEVVTMMAGRGEKQRFLRRLDGAYRRAEGRSEPRLWTIEQPNWWVDASTVDRRRALTAFERERWLGHRRTSRDGRELA